MSTISLENKAKPVKCSNLGKKNNQNHSPTKHEKDLFY